MPMVSYSGALLGNGFALGSYEFLWVRVGFLLVSFWFPVGFIWALTLETESVLRNESPLGSYAFLFRKPIWCLEIGSHWVPMGYFGFLPFPETDLEF